MKTNYLKEKDPFESFLQDQHAEDYHGGDDEMPDAFDNWLGDLQADEYLAYGNMFAFVISKEQLEKDYENSVDIMNKVFNKTI